MTATPTLRPPSSLSPPGCRSRQERLRRVLAAEKLEAALLTEPRHVHYFTGYWSPSYPVALYLPLEGESLLSAPSAPGDLASTQGVEVYELQRLCTLVEDPPRAALEPLLAPLSTVRRVGADGASRPWSLRNVELHDLGASLRALRRSKDPDEVDLLRRAISATEAAYAHARSVLRPGVTEIELFAQMQATAVVASGEPIGPFGNDFQFGSPGGPPRHRAAVAGELAVLDVSVHLRGYSSDLCRTFIIGAEPSPAQSDAHRRVVEALAYVEGSVRPGVSCKGLFAEVHRRLSRNERGWEFFHHLGHGIGLSGHEAPRLNPNWDDTFEEGDVFTAEPGLYGADLRAGIRLEHNYRVTADGIERLSAFPLDL